MARPTSSRVQRLEELKGLLRSREHATAAELAAELGVSLRTLNRDLALLRELGIAIDSDRGRGGGLRLHRSWSLGRLQLSPAEAIDVLLSITIAEQMSSPVLLQQLPAIRRKIVAAFADQQQSRIRALRKRILIGRPASPRIAASYAPVPKKALAGLGEAFFNMLCIVIDYVDEKGRATSRTVEPQFLYLSLPVWYLLAWDRLRSAIRYFRLDRIRSFTVLESHFPLADPRPYLAEAERGIQTL